MTDEWLKAMDSSKLMGKIFLDLSKAFDLVNHNILLSKLVKYYISLCTLDGFSYLRDW